MQLLFISFQILLQLFGLSDRPSTAISRASAPAVTLPKVFIIGQNPELESILNQEYNYSLVSVFNEDPQAAFGEWSNMLIRMDQLCTTAPELDVRGIKAYATFYWSRDGSLKYVGYALKSNSRFVKHADLEYYFTRFMATYKLPVPKGNKHKFIHSYTLTLPYPREITISRPPLSHSN
jgi:hypothetical protein